MKFEPAWVKNIKEKLGEFAFYNMISFILIPRKVTTAVLTSGQHLWGAGITAPIREGKCILGTWQQIVVFDHNNQVRKRHVAVQVIGKEIE